MPKLSANLSFLFPDVAFAERFARAADAGFRGVEYLFPYDYPVDELAHLLRAYRLQQVLYNLPAGDWQAGERGIACLPGREAEFREGVERALEYARLLDCRQINCLAGIAPTGVPDAEIRAAFVANVRHAASRLGEHDIRLLIEPINSRVDMPGFWLDTPRKAEALMTEIAETNLWLQYDVYHAQIMEGDLARTIERNIGRIAHIQLADNPGRHEPGTGEINFPFLFRVLGHLGYRGWLGCEYRPLSADANGTEQGLRWATDWPPG
ncbi:MAG TPA: hydroxypyruvate isomerase [Accumulibacter sp.]|nr:hydroxypyruvate isomerase [Accumulibacter sp.]